MGWRNPWVNRRPGFLKPRTGRPSGGTDGNNGTDGDRTSLVIDCTCPRFFVFPFRRVTAVPRYGLYQPGRAIVDSHGWSEPVQGSRKPWSTGAPDSGCPERGGRAGHKREQVQLGHLRDLSHFLPLNARPRLDESQIHLCGNEIMTKCTASLRLVDHGLQTCLNNTQAIRIVCRPRH